MAVMVAVKATQPEANQPPNTENMKRRRLGPSLAGGLGGAGLAGALGLAAGPGGGAAAVAPAAPSGATGAPADVFSDMQLSRLSNEFQRAANDDCLFTFYLRKRWRQPWPAA